MYYLFMFGVEVFEQVVEVGFDVFVVLGQVGQGIGLQVDVGKQVFVEVVCCDFVCQVVMGVGNELEIVLCFDIGIDWQKVFFFDGFE